MGKKQPKMWLVREIQLKQAESAEKAMQVKNQKYQRLLDQFCERLDVFLTLFEEQLSDQVSEVARKANLVLMRFFIDRDGLQRHRRYRDFNAQLENCIDTCLHHRLPRNYGSEADYIRAYVPQIKQELYDAVVIYDRLDALFNFALTRDPNNGPKSRVESLIATLKEFRDPECPAREVIGDLLFILNPKTSAALLQRHGLYAQLEDHENVERPVRRRNKAVRF
ncbi:MAG TPA: hypothetical protein VFU82_01475 [Gammaproteobacteria bacterium]|nr:hypothetical protein [Gammaproteobacteria bacterium]